MNTKATLTLANGAAFEIEVLVPISARVGDSSMVTPLNPQALEVSLNNALALGDTARFSMRVVGKAAA